eukprot:scaffold110671_cov32-Tisochrysis_lutea.AAC.2
MKLWEVSSGRCERTIKLGGDVRSVRWCPSSDVAMAAAIVGAKMVLLCPLRLPLPAVQRATELLDNARQANGEDSDASESGIPWARPDGALREAGVYWEVTHVKSASSVCWHHKGDYLASVAPEGASRAVLLHQISKHKSGSPFSKSTGRVEAVAFHPKKPWLVVATQRHVRIYDLASQVTMPPDGDVSEINMPASLRCSSSHGYAMSHTRLDDESKLYFTSLSRSVRPVRGGAKVWTILLTWERQILHHLLAQLLDALSFMRYNTSS